MNTVTRASRKLIFTTLAAVCSLSFIGCNYDFPITSGPTRKIDERLLGNWVSKDGEEKMKVRKMDDSVYIVSYNGDLFRCFHSDVAKTPFISVQDIDSADRKYAYLSYRLSDDGRQLVLQPVNTRLVPSETKNAASVRRLLRKNLRNPELFEEEGQFTREK